eukprot:2262030-Amphidinium_carterae.2
MMQIVQCRLRWADLMDEEEDPTALTNCPIVRSYGLTLAEIDWLQSGLEADGLALIHVAKFMLSYVQTGCVHEDTVLPENAALPSTCEEATGVLGLRH